MKTKLMLVLLFASLLFVSASAQSYGPVVTESGIAAKVMTKVRNANGDDGRKDLDANLFNRPDEETEVQSYRMQTACFGKFCTPVPTSVGMYGEQSHFEFSWVKTINPNRFRSYRSFFINGNGGTLKLSRSEKLRKTVFLNFLVEGTAWDRSEMDVIVKVRNFGDSTKTLGRMRLLFNPQTGKVGFTFLSANSTLTDPSTGFSVGRVSRNLTDNNGAHVMPHGEFNEMKAEIVDGKWWSISDIVIWLTPGDDFMNADLFVEVENRTGKMAGIEVPAVTYIDPVLYKRAQTFIP